MNDELRINVVKLHNRLEILYPIKDGNTVIKMNEKTCEILKSDGISRGPNKISERFNLSFNRMFGFKVKIDNSIPINKFVIEIVI